MLRLFISYRRADSATITGRIYDRLVDKFGEDSVFRDVTSIGIGVDFREKIQEAIGQCDIALIVIGSEWIHITGEDNQRRLEDEEDFVRIEVEAALQRNDILTVPLFVEDANAPSPEDLPATMRKLSYINGLRIRNDPDFNRDVEILVDSIQARLKSTSTSTFSSIRPDLIFLSSLLITVLLLVAGMLSAESRFSMNPVTDTDDEFDLRVTQLIRDVTDTAIAPLTETAMSIGFINTSTPTIDPFVRTSIPTVNPFALTATQIIANATSTAVALQLPSPANEGIVRMDSVTSIPTLIPYPTFTDAPTLNATQRVNATEEEATIIALVEMALTETRTARDATNVAQDIYIRVLNTQVAAGEIGKGSPADLNTGQGGDVAASGTGGIGLYYCVHEVRSGDTISNIASRYGLTSVEIEQENLLEPDDFQAGLRLIIPDCGMTGYYPPPTSTSIATNTLPVRTSTPTPINTIVPTETGTATATATTVPPLAGFNDTVQDVVGRVDPIVPVVLSIVTGMVIVIQSISYYLLRRPPHINGMLSIWRIDDSKDSIVQSINLSSSQRNSIRLSQRELPEPFRKIWMRQEGKEQAIQVNIELASDEADYSGILLFGDRVPFKLSDGRHYRVHYDQLVGSDRL